MPNRIFCIMGPTASGKTALAFELLKRFPFEIISVDSALIYRGMDIGTAKPSSQELIAAPHHLIDILNPDQPYSAAQFCIDATSLCESIFAKGKIPLLVGGTMMYFNALQKGLSTLPEADESIRNRLESEASNEGWEVLHQRLMMIDPQSAARIHANDAQRIQRALEVFYITGSTLSDLLAYPKNLPDYEFINIALFPQDRSWLHDRIAQRFDTMLAKGFIDEVIHLRDRWQLSDTMPSMRCVGYRQALEFIEGRCDYATMREKGIAATRQLAKRQLTWLRHWEGALEYDPQNSSFITEIIGAVDNSF